MRVFLGVPARVACRCVIAFCFVLFQSSRRPPISRKSNQLSGLLVAGDGKQAKKAKSAHNRKMFAVAGCPFSLGPSDRLHHFYGFVPNSLFFSSAALRVFLFLPDFARALCPPPPNTQCFQFPHSLQFFHSLHFFHSFHFPHAFNLLLLSISPSSPTPPDFTQTFPLPLFVPIFFSFRSLSFLFFPLFPYRPPPRRLASWNFA